MAEKNVKDHRQGEIPGNSDSQSSGHHSDERRRVLKKILAGGGIAAGAAMLPERWTRPVVDAIVAPAHAQGSPPAEPVSVTARPTAAPPV